MDKFDFYRRYFEQNSNFFWPKIERLQPYAMVAQIQDKIWKVLPMAKVACGYDGAGYWFCQFAILTQELNRLDRTSAKAEIKRFRDCARKQMEYNRRPEDQRDVFNDEKWRKK